MSLTLFRLFIAHNRKCLPNACQIVVPAAISLGVERGDTAELGNLTSLTELNLFNNQLTSEIPQELGNLTNLHVLRVSENQLTGEIPAGLGNLANLTELVLNENQLSGCLPSNLIGRLDDEISDLGGLPFCP